MDSAAIKAGTNYRSTVRRVDGVVILSLVTEIGAPCGGFESRVYYTNNGVPMVGRLSVFALTHEAL